MIIYDTIENSKLMTDAVGVSASPLFIYFKVDKIVKCPLPIFLLHIQNPIKNKCAWLVPFDVEGEKIPPLIISLLFLQSKDGAIIG
jgi:hypothetical protein